MSKAINQEQIIKEIASAIHDLGGRALLVGGCVRDQLLGIPCYDIDCEVHGVAPDALRALLERFGEIDGSGEKYGIFTIRGAGIDVALPRKEARTGPGHKDFAVRVDPMLPPEIAAARRDFTINAVMRDALTGEYVDPFGGIEDLKKGVLCAVPGGQFEEDPLRVLRGAQFAARFHLAPDAETMGKMQRMPVHTLSAARVMDETKKALLKSDRPSIYFHVLEKADALNPWFKELAALRSIPQNPVYHPEGDALAHTLMVLDEAAAIRDKMDDPLSFMLAGLCHDLGKATAMQVREDGRIQAIGHEHTGVPLIGNMLTRLSVNKHTIAYVKNMCKLHMRVHTCYYGKARVSRTNVLFDESMSPEELAWLVVCDSRGTGKPREKADIEEAFIMERLALYREAAAGPMPDARMLMAAGCAPGPGLKSAIAKARELVLGGETIEKAVSRAIALSGPAGQLSLKGEL